MLENMGVIMVLLEVELQELVIHPAKETRKILSDKRLNLTLKYSKVFNVFLKLIIQKNKTNLRTLQVVG